MNDLKEEKVQINGIAYNYVFHTEVVDTCGNVFPAHYHDYIELLYNINGTFDVMLNGKRHLFSKGDLILINSKEVHQIDSRSIDGGVYYVLRFELEVIYNAMADSYFGYKYILPFIMSNPSFQKVIPSTVIKDTEIPIYFEEIKKEYQDQDYGYELAVKIHINQIYLWIIRYLNHTCINMIQISYTDETFTKLLQHALDYILIHYSEDIKEGDLAQCCNMSSSYFSRKFNKYMQMSLKEYINRIRVMEAEKLLVSTSLTVTAISSTVGFNSTSYFIELFQKYRGISPQQFRKEFTCRPASQ